MTVQRNEQKSKDTETIHRNTGKLPKKKEKCWNDYFCHSFCSATLHLGKDASGSDDKKYSWTDKYFHADMSYWGQYHETWIDVSADRAKQHPLQVKYNFILEIMVVSIDITA